MCRYCTKKYFPQRSRIEASHVGRPRHFGSLFLHITLNSVWTLHTMHSACKIYQGRQSIHPDQMPSHQTGWSWSSAALTFLLGSVEINMVHIWSIYESTFKFIWSEHLIIACMATVTWGQALRSQLHALHLLHAFNCLFQHFREEPVEWNYSHKHKDAIEGWVLKSHLMVRRCPVISGDSVTGSRWRWMPRRHHQSKYKYKFLQLCRWCTRCLFQNAVTPVWSEGRLCRYQVPTNDFTILLLLRME